MPGASLPDPESFPPLPDDRARRWSRFGSWDTVYFPSYVGIRLEEVRTDYCRIRMPHRPELDQPGGSLHGGAIATLLDTVVVPAVGAGYDQATPMLTVSMTVDYVGTVRGEDAIAHGWVVRRGRSIVFCEAAVVGARGSLAATASLVYSVRPPT